MRNFLMITCILSLVGCASTPEVATAPAATAEKPAQVYGPGIGDGAIVPVADILANTDKFNGQDLKVEGQIVQVCQKMGCWFELSPGAGSTAHVRVKSPGHDVLIPKDSAGRMAVVRGKVVVNDLPAEEAEHYASEGGNAAAGKEIGIEMVAVEIR